MLFIYPFIFLYFLEIYTKIDEFEEKVETNKEEHFEKECKEKIPKKQ